MLFPVRDVLVRKILFFALMFCVIPGSQAGNAPLFTLPSDTGSISLNSYNGDVVYLIFWASWCKSCVDSMPWLNQLQKRYTGKGFRIIAVTMDDDPDEAKAVVQSKFSALSIAYDPEGVAASEYRLKGMPSSYLIDRNGNLVQQRNGLGDSDKTFLEQAIKELLKY